MIFQIMIRLEKLELLEIQQNLLEKHLYELKLIQVIVNDLN